MRAGSYVIRGGAEGRERLRLLSEVMGASTRALLDSVGIGPGSVCLDVGCGGGDVALELAKRTGATGRVVGLDIDGAKIAIAESEASEQGIANAEFHVSDVTDWQPTEIFDVVYARFLLSHITDPAALLGVLRRCIRPGGSIVIEDVDFRGHFSEPRSAAFERYVELYTESVRRRGGDANTGPRLPRLLRDAGFGNVDVRVAHPVALVGGIKTLSCVTLESIEAAVVRDGLIDQDSLKELIEELRAFADDPLTVIGGPRVFQVWGRVEGAQE